MSPERVLLSTLVLLIMSACQPQTPPSALALSESDIEVIKNEVQQAADRLVAAGEAVDATSIGQLLSEDEAVVFASDGMLFGSKQRIVEGILPAWEGYLQSQIIELEHSEITVLTKDIAIQSMSGTVSQSLTVDSTTLQQRLAGTFVWKNTEQGWQLLHLHHSFALMD